MLKTHLKPRILIVDDEYFNVDAAIIILEYSAGLKTPNKFVTTRKMVRWRSEKYNKMSKKTMEC